VAKLAKLTPTLSVFGKAKGGTVCYYCGKPGHWKKDCLELKATKIQAAARGYLSRLRVHQMKAKRSTEVQTSLKVMGTTACPPCLLAHQVASMLCCVYLN
jgi:hypothetical protein